MSVQIITPPSSEPVTSAEIKARLRTSSTADDTLIGQLITTARVYAEKQLHKSLVLKSYAYYRERFPWAYEAICVPVTPLQSVTAIKYVDGLGVLQTLDPAEYVVSTVNVPGLIKPAPNTVWPCPASAVEVDFTAGPVSAGQLADVSDIYEGIRALTIFLYEHPDLITAEGLKEAPISPSKFFGSINKVWTF